MKTTVRDRLVGKPLIGFDTTRWVKPGDATPISARIGAKGKPPGGGGPTNPDPGNV